MAKVYYNEFDPKAAAWLRELMASNLIPQGDVDERSIVDIRGSDLAGHVQCHFFAGIGGWPHALNLAGWGDRSIWTGSCPCQPFSQAGKGEGEQDSRHLWPHLLRLIEECRPSTVFGEQVASKAGRRWLNGVRTDLEALDYEVGAADLCAASVGAPHIRQRLFWVAQSERGAAERHRFQVAGTQSSMQGKASQRERLRADARDGCEFGWLDDTDITRSQGRRIDAGEYTDQCASGTPGEFGGIEHIGEETRSAQFTNSGARGDSATCRLADPKDANGRRDERANHDRGGIEETGRSGAWSDFDILHCTDGKARRVEAGTFPLAHGIPARMGRLRGYGNAIVPELAAEFIKAYLES